MTAIASHLATSFLQTLADVIPIVIVVAAFQAFAFRRVPPHVERILWGVAAIVAGISLFRAGLSLSFIPVSDNLAERLAGRVAAPEHPTLLNAIWLVVYAGCLGFAATLIEPTLTGIANRVRELTGGGLQPLGFRLVVAVGVALGLALGTARILVDLPFLLLVGVLMLIGGAAAAAAPRPLVALALDSGPMATSVVTVPIIAAFGASLARHLPGRDPLTDGFGLVLLALLTPVTCLLVFAQFRLLLDRMRQGGR